MGFSLQAQNLKLLKDIRPGSEGSEPFFERNTMAVGNKLFFTAEEISGDESLFVTDGTPAGTIKLIDLNDFNNLTSYNNKLIFIGRDGNGNELWVSDGTVAGTKILKDINPGFLSGCAPASRPMIEHNGNLYFRAYKGTQNKAGIWRTDGTEAGTIELNSELSSSYQNDWFTIFKDKLYFYGTSNLDKPGKLHFFDFSTNQISMIEDSFSGANEFEMSDLIVCGDLLYFLANFAGAVKFEPGVTDGTPSGTKLLKDLRAGDSNPFQIQCVGKKAVMANLDFTYTSDGTGPGTVSLGLWSDPRVKFGPNKDTSLLFFRAVKPGSIGEELYVTDGTLNGTRLVKDIEPSTSVTAESKVNNLVWYRSKLYLTAQNTTTGPRIWVSDGSSSGTQPLTNMADGKIVTNPNALTPFGDFIFFFGNHSGLGSEPSVVELGPSSIKSTGEQLNSLIILDHDQNWLVSWDQNLNPGFINLYDLTGVQVSSLILNSNTHSTELTKPAISGIYFISLVDQLGKVIGIQKVAK